MEFEVDLTSTDSVMGRKVSSTTLYSPFHLVNVTNPGHHIKLFLELLQLNLIDIPVGGQNVKFFKI